MTTLTPHPFLGELTSQAFNDRLDEIEAAIDAVMTAGLVEAGTTLDAQALAGQKVVPVASTAGFVIGDPVWIGTVGSGLQETGVIASIQAGVSLTLVANLANTHQAGEPVTRSPSEVVDARGTAATLRERLEQFDLGFVSVKRYGAVGDGAVDDTAAIAAAIAGAPIGSTVYAPPGTYLASVLVNKRVSFVGAGPDQTIIVPPAGASGRTVDIDPGVNVSGLRIGGFTVDNSAKPTIGAMRVRDLHYAEVSDIHLIKGTTLLDVGGSGTHFERIHLFDATANGVLIDADLGAEQFWTDIKYEHRVATAVSGGLFKITRTAATDIGAFYLDRVHVTNPGGGALGGGIVVTSTASGTEMPIFMEMCVSDGIKNAAALIVHNVNDVRATGCWFHSVGTTSFGVELFQVAKHYYLVCRFSGANGSANLDGFINDTVWIGNYMPNEPSFDVTGAAPLRTILHINQLSATPSNDYSKLAPFIASKVFRQAAATLTSGAGSFLSWTVVSEDPHDFWSAGTPTRLTCPTGFHGMYIPSVNVRFAANATGARYVAIRKNGTTYIGVAEVQAAAGGAPTVVAFSAPPVFLAAGDYLEVEVAQFSGGSLDVEWAADYGMSFGLAKVA